MRSNILKAKVSAGERTWGVSFAHKSLPMVEIAAKLGFDYIFLEGEHGALSLSDVEEMCILADALGLGTVARVPSIDPGRILQFLDRGVMCIRAPHTSTAEEVKKVVEACRFPPEGVRSISSSRAHGYDTPAEMERYTAMVNREVMTIAMIEDNEALANLPDILAIEGLDVVAFGPFDLAQSLGESSPDGPRTSTAMADAVQRVRASGKVNERDLMNRIDALKLFKAGAVEYLDKVRES